MAERENRLIDFQREKYYYPAMSRSKEVILPEPLGEIIKNILRAARESGQDLLPVESSLVLIGLSRKAHLEYCSILYKALIAYEKWLASDGNNSWWREFVRNFRGVKAESSGGKVKLPPFSGVVVLNLPCIPKRPLANEVLQRRFVRALGIPDWQQWHNLLTSHPQCTALSAWGDGNTVTCRVTRDQGSLWIKSDRVKNTEEFILLSRYPGVAVGLLFYPLMKQTDVPLEQLIPKGGAVIKTSAFFSPDLLLGSPPNRLQMPVGRDPFLEALPRLVLKS